MANMITGILIVEGQTEQIFVEKLLAPYLALKNIFVCATQVSKKSQKGGDVKFERIENDLRIHLNQQHNHFVSTFIDYYGVKQWPATELIKSNHTPEQIAKIINSASQQLVQEKFPNLRTEERYIPFLAVHEFEALLFSDAEILAQKIEGNPEEISKLIHKYGNPEAINNSPQTAPSKRLENLGKIHFRKTTIGIDIAEAIGIAKMREACPNFNNWLTQIESLVKKQ